MADNVNLLHPVTGAAKSVSGKDAERLLADGWVDTTPHERSANSGRPEPERDEPSGGSDG
jgi:hypothetical protein